MFFCATAHAAEVSVTSVAASRGAAKIAPSLQPLKRSLKVLPFTTFSDKGTLSKSIATGSSGVFALAEGYQLKASVISATATHITVKTIISKGGKEIGTTTTKSPLNAPMVIGGPKLSNGKTLVLVLIVR